MSTDVETSIELKRYAADPIVLDVSKNSYYARSKENFLKLVQLMNLRPKHYQWDLKRDHLLMQWIQEVTASCLKGDAYTLSTRIYWILVGIESFEDERVQCKKCGTPFENKNVGSAASGYKHEFCSAKCAATFQETKDKKAATTLKNFGVTCSMKSPVVVQKMLDNFKKKHGVVGTLNVPEFRAKFLGTMQAIHGVDWPMQDPNVHAKAMQSTLKHLGVCFPTQNEEVMARLAAHFFEKFGGYPMQSKEVFQKMLDSCKLSNGIPLSADIVSPSQIPSIAKKISSTKQSRSEEQVASKVSKAQETCKDRYGEDSIFKVPEFQEKCKASMLDHYGVEHPSQSPEIQARMHKKYEWNGLAFDSAPEIAYWIWLKDNGIRFVFHPETSLEFEFEGKTCSYFPDFWLEDEKVFVEVKGDHFFAEDGTMVASYRGREESEEAYQRRCAKQEAKHQCMLKNGVRILKTSSPEIQAALAWVRYKHGVEFFEQCKKEK